MSGFDRGAFEMPKNKDGFEPGENVSFYDILRMRNKPEKQAKRKKRRVEEKPDAEQEV